MENDPRHALQEAISRAGNARKLALAIGVTAQALSQWETVPPMRVLDVERISGVARHRLRPDIYPPPEGERDGDAA